MSQKLFQLIVTEPEKKGAYEKMMSETRHVFKGQDLFLGLVKMYTPKNENGDPLPEERKEVVTTVNGRLSWGNHSVTELLDYELSRDLTNMQAKADIVVDGVTLAKGVPATNLLSLEKRLRELRDVYDQIPTLDLSKPWKQHEGNPGLWVWGPVEQYRTAKKTVPVIMAPATDKHPAQVKDVVEDVTIGTFRTTIFSGAVHPGTKAQWLGRIDKLITAVKDARMRANDVPVVEGAVGSSIMTYIHSK